MHLLRIFAQQGLFSHWLVKSPPLFDFFKCFGLQLQTPNPETSVYRADSELEEAEAVGAHFLITAGTLEKRFGVLVTDDDCQSAGVTIDLEQAGTTGICGIDGRHVNLKGTSDQLVQLMTRIAQGMWQGEQRLRAYPAHQIAGQIAIFSRLPDDRIDPVAKKTCLEVLSASNWHSFEEHPAAVVVRGAFENKPDLPIIARRKF
jgi:hypothetical protein